MAGTLLLNQSAQSFRTRIHRFLIQDSSTMSAVSTLLLSLLMLSGQALTAPNSSPASIEERQASCSFSGADGAAKVKAGKSGCTTITLSNLIVPAGTTLDLTGLNKGTKVGI